MSPKIAIHKANSSRRMFPPLEKKQKLSENIININKNITREGFGIKI